MTDGKTEDKAEDETPDGGKTVTPAKAKAAKAKAPSKTPKKKTPETPDKKEDSADSVPDVEMEKVAIPRTPITDPPPPRPSIMRVQVLKNAAGFFRGEFHDLPAEVAEDLMHRKIAIRVEI